MSLMHAKYPNLELLEFKARVMLSKDSEFTEEVDKKRKENKYRSVSIRYSHIQPVFQQDLLYFSRTSILYSVRLQVYVLISSFFPPESDESDFSDFFLPFPPYLTANAIASSPISSLLFFPFIFFWHLS